MRELNVKEINFVSGGSIFNNPIKAVIDAVVDTVNTVGKFIQAGKNVVEGVISGIGAFKKFWGL